MCYRFNILLDLSHSHDVAGTVAHNLNNVCKFGYMSLSQVFKDCAIVEGYCANSLRPTQNIRERCYGLLQESL